MDITEAIKANDTAKVTTLLDRDPKLIEMETDEGSLVLTAVYHAAWDVVDMLVDRARQLNIFEAAAVGEDSRVLEILNDEPRLANASNRDGFTPLGLAAFFGHEPVVKALLHKGAEIDTVMGSANANTALDAAVAARRTEVVRLLLAKGAEVNVRAAGGYTPLHKAVFGGDLGMIRLLLDSGADLHARTDEGKKPVDVASERGLKDVVKLLTEHGAQS